MQLWQRLSQAQAAELGAEAETAREIWEGRLAGRRWPLVPCVVPIWCRCAAGGWCCYPRRVLDAL